MGRVSEAIDSAEDALVDPHAWPIERPAAAAALVDARRLQGDLAAAAEVLAQHPVDLGTDRGPLRSAELQWALAAARLALETGDASHALWLADRALGCSAMARAFGADEVRALALAATGEVQRARSVSAEAVVRTAAAAPHRSAAALAIDGRLRGDLDAVEAAAELAARSSSPIGRGEVLIALGHERLRAGRRTPARDAFREALSSAEHAGAHDQARRASDGLRLAGGRPRRTALVGVASLTPSEERICRLVAGGRSNREVAESLFLSRKTVEYHLGNAYGKLGIASRDALADVFESTEAP
jgi:DNA-binding CsgD family transcriptional regulator